MSASFILSPYGAVLWREDRVPGRYGTPPYCRSMPYLSVRCSFASAVWQETGLEVRPAAAASGNASPLFFRLEFRVAGWLEQERPFRPRTALRAGCGRQRWGQRFAALCSRHQPQIALGGGNGRDRKEAARSAGWRYGIMTPGRPRKWVLAVTSWAWKTRAVA